MSAELATRAPAQLAPRMSLDEKIRYAQVLSDAGLLPAQYRKQPGNVLFALEYAEALGVQPINAITSIHVIEGKPSASADLIGSLVRKAGHRMRVSGDDTWALCEITRADDPEFTFSARWDMAKASAARLHTKDVWKSYPGAMLRARAITECARAAAPDALFGVIYTPEELGANVDGEGNVVQVTSERAPADQAGPPVSGTVEDRPSSPSVPRDGGALDATGQDCDAWQARIAAATTMDAMRAMWREAGPARDRDCGGKLLHVRMTERMAEIQAEDERAAAEIDTAAAAEAEEPDSAEDVPEGVGEPVVHTASVRADAVEGEVLPAAPVVEADPEPDPEDLRRMTGQRKAVLRELSERLGGDDARDSNAVVEFRQVIEDVSTARLRTWMGKLQVAARPA